jgi:hypothetical protein
MTATFMVALPSVTSRSTRLRLHEAPNARGHAAHNDRHMP